MFNTILSENIHVLEGTNINKRAYMFYLGVIFAHKNKIVFDNIRSTKDYSICICEYLTSNGLDVFKGRDTLQDDELWDALGMASVHAAPSFYK